MVEFVLSVKLNHAFAIQHWTAPPWQTSVATLALSWWREEWWQAQPLRASAPSASLLPALLQPSLASKLGGGIAAIEALSRSDAQRRRRLIKLGMYADAREHLNIDLG